MNRSDWRDKVIYQIFVDRFAGYKHPEKWTNFDYIGGTINGITDKLTYIQSLGVDAVWLTPFCKGSAFHGYCTTDFYDVDPRFGTMQDVQRLLDEAHKLGLRVIFDFVPNHCSNKHPFFIDAAAKTNSKYRDWFFFDKWPRKYRTFFDARSLPKLNLDNPEVIEHLQGAARMWLQLGFDGFRIDHIVGLSNKNIADLFGPLRKEFPEAVMFGEAWFKGISYKFMRGIRVPKKYRLWILWMFGFNPEKLLYENYVGLIDGILDFSAQNDFRLYAKANNQWRRTRIRKRLIKKSGIFGNALLRFTFLDSHDAERFLAICGNDIERLKAAATLQLELDQPAIIYYGTEVGATQSMRFKQFKRSKHKEILARKPMPWEPSEQDLGLLRFYKHIIAERK